MSNNRLYVGNLSFRTDEHALREAFQAFGEVTSATIATDRDTGRSRGFGFVEMDSEDSAQAAIEGMDGQEFEGRTLTVNVARPREDRRGGGGGGGRGRGGW